MVSQKVQQLTAFSFVFEIVITRPSHPNLAGHPHLQPMRPPRRSDRAEWFSMLSIGVDRESTGSRQLFSQRFPENNLLGEFCNVHDSTLAVNDDTASN